MAFSHDAAPASRAPYNFVPLPKHVFRPASEANAPSHDAFIEGRLCGEIDVVVTTETWLYTRGGVSPEYAARHPDQNADVWQQNSRYREFWHHGDRDKPVIPGSIFRGMVRHLVTVLADGHLNTSKTQILYRAVADTTRFGWFYRRRFVGPNTLSKDGRVDPNPTGLPQRLEYPVRDADPSNEWKQNSVHGGWLRLRKDGRDWVIQPAQCHPARTNESFIHVDERTLEESLRQRIQNQNLTPQTIPIWVRPVPREPHDHSKPQGKLTLVHTLTDRAETTEFSGGVEATLVVTGRVGPKHMHCAVFRPDDTAPPRAIDADRWRLYRDDRDQPRGKGREGRDLEREFDDLPNNLKGRGVPCFYMLDAEGDLVFFGGTLFFRLHYRRTPADLAGSRDGTDLSMSLLGYVRDGECRKGRVRFEDLVLEPGQESPFVRELGDGYRSPQTLLGPKLACVQHYLEQPSGNTRDLKHYDDKNAVLRGFKFYWHRKDTAQESTEPWGQVPVNARKTRTVIRPVRPAVRFRGRIAFDNLTDGELGALLTALELKPSMRQKLGMARSLGYGTIKVTTTVHLLDPGKRYQWFFTPAADSDPATDRDPTAHSVLEAGWRERQETDRLCAEARLAFFKALCASRRQPVPETDTKDTKKALEAARNKFWDFEHMKELAALLEWDQAPDAEATAPVPIQNDPQSEQWRRRWILPRATQVSRRRGPGGLNRLGDGRRGY